MYHRECSVKCSEFFNYVQWCPHVDELLIRPRLQDRFASLKDHGFMDGITILHLYDNYNVKDCYLVTYPALGALPIVFGI